MSAIAPSAALWRMYKEIRYTSICSQLSIIPGIRVVVTWNTNVSVNFGQDGHLMTVTFGLHSAIQLTSTHPLVWRVFFPVVSTRHSPYLFFIFRFIKMYVSMLWLVTQSCPTLCNPMDYSLPCSSVHGILQARILEWVAMSSSVGSSQPRDQTQVSYIAGRFFTI